MKRNRVRDAGVEHCEFGAHELQPIRDADGGGVVRRCAFDVQMGRYRSGERLLFCKYAHCCSHHIFTEDRCLADKTLLPEKNLVLRLLQRAVHKFKKMSSGQFALLCHLADQAK